MTNSTEGSTAARQQGVLKWVGYDSSAGCVAQALVVAKMLGMGMDIDAVLQVGKFRLCSALNVCACVCVCV